MATLALCPRCNSHFTKPHAARAHRSSRRPDVAWRWGKWTFGFWVDRANHTLLGVDVGPLEVVWRTEGYRP